MGDSVSDTSLSSSFMMAHNMEELEAGTRNHVTSTTVEYEGLLNSRQKFLSFLEPSQQAQMTSLRLFYRNLAQLPVDLRAKGSKVWDSHVQELELRKGSLDDCVEFNPKKSIDEALNLVQK